MTPFNKDYFMYIEKDATIISSTKRALIKEVLIYYVKKRIIFNTLYKVKGAFLND